jgi:CBS-domain-containing membrane protein
MEMIHVMTRHPETIHADDTLAKAKEMIDAAGFRRLPVVKDGEVVGMLTERDLRAHAGYLESSKVNAALVRVCTRPAILTRGDMLILGLPSTCVRSPRTGTFPLRCAALSTRAIQDLTKRPQPLGWRLRP